MTDPLDEFEEEPDIPPGPEVAPGLFLEWRSPRFGSSNPEQMNNPVWEWLIRSRVSAYSANKQLGGPSPFEAGPGWCFNRFGQSSTQLADGRLVLIAGEHEDSYDPDFYIYNDVVVRHPDGHLDIFCYPKDVFPPTDFHSATLEGNRIIIIGSLGYYGERKPGATPVMILDLDTFSISQVNTSGTLPGWLYEHTASLSEDGSSILITGGKVDRGEETSTVENIDDWRLHLADWRWERITDRQWQRWEATRKDGEPNHLFNARLALWYREGKWNKDCREEMERQGLEELEKLKDEYGVPPDLDLVAKLYRPDIPHELVAGEENDYKVFRIKVQGVVVRYVEDFHAVQITVEGDLPQQVTDAITSDLIGKLSALENTPYELKRL